jgi:hypothetical protein
MEQKLESLVILRHPEGSRPAMPPSTWAQILRLQLRMTPGSGEHPPRHFFIGNPSAFLNPRITSEHTHPSDNIP